MKENVLGVGLYAVDNRGFYGLEHFYGQPFLAKDDETAKQYVRESLEKNFIENGVKVALKDFDLVCLGVYNGSAENPLTETFVERFPVIDFFGYPVQLISGDALDPEENVVISDEQ